MAATFRGQRDRFLVPANELNCNITLDLKNYDINSKKDMRLKVRIK